jgi:putative membrane protein
VNVRTCLLFAAPIFALGACGEHSDVQRANSADLGNSPTAPSVKSGNVTGELYNTASPIAPSAQDFANTIAASDEFEIETSKFALTNARSPAVKDFARKMIDAHKQSTEKLKKAAGSAAPMITPDATLAPDQLKALEQLHAKKGADFDQQYVILQRDAHERTLAALNDYSVKGDQPPLNAFANAVIPIVSGHLAMARNLKP